MIQGFANLSFIFLNLLTNLQCQYECYLISKEVIRIRFYQALAFSFLISIYSALIRNQLSCQQLKILLIIVYSFWCTHYQINFIFAIHLFQTSECASGQVSKKKQSSSVTKILKALDYYDLMPSSNKYFLTAFSSDKLLNNKI